MAKRKISIEDLEIEKFNPTENDLFVIKYPPFASAREVDELEKTLHQIEHKIKTNFLLVPSDYDFSQHQKKIQEFCLQFVNPRVLDKQ